MRLFPLVTQGPYCPRCGDRTDRVRTPFFLRPVRVVAPDIQRRACGSVTCFWRGFALPLRVDQPADARPTAAN